MDRGLRSQVGNTRTKLNCFVCGSTGMASRPRHFSSPASSPRALTVASGPSSPRNQASTWVRESGVAVVVTVMSTLGWLVSACLRLTQR